MKALRSTVAIPTTLSLQAQGAARRKVQDFEGNYVTRMYIVASRHVLAPRLLDVLWECLSSSLDTPLNRNSSPNGPEERASRSQRATVLSWLNGQDLEQGHLDGFTMYAALIHQNT